MCLESEFGEYTKVILTIPEEMRKNMYRLMIIDDDKAIRGTYKGKHPMGEHGT